MEYGLIGKKLGHSFSKIIHEDISPITYELTELNEDEVITLLKEKNLKAINVTIPYKQLVIPYLDHIDKTAKKINAVNTIININNELYGFNTDYLGLKKMLIDHNVNVKGLVCAILGNGGTHNTSEEVLNQLGAKKVYTVSRRNEPNTITYEELYSLKDVALIINTTPVGMYPHNDDTLIDLSKLPNLKYVIDVIFNPLRTNLILQAKELNTKAIGGLEMLINQGIYANELFLQTEHSKKLFKQIYQKLYLEKVNIVLIGMPMSGKTIAGKKFKTLFNKKFVDTDKEIEKRIGMPIKDFFQKYGEAKFREIEEEVIKEVSSQNGLVISTGGGVIKNPKNMMRLKQNGFIVHLTRSDDLLTFNDNRPLTQNMEEYHKLKKERLPLFRKYMDIEVENKNNTKRIAYKIKEALYESINY